MIDMARWPEGLGIAGGGEGAGLGLGVKRGFWVCVLCLGLSGHLGIVSGGVVWHGIVGGSLYPTSVCVLGREPSMWGERWLRAR